ncbi:MAG: dihydrofolate reductase [Verrucomicrobia bacterium]|nr:MAG: dihydrofolate reductase [Verrucomicrobiota bacterium]
MRKIIAALQVSVDGFIEGPNGELDWAMAEDEETWRDVFEMLESVDTCILGRVMYPEYEQYWLAVLANPGGPPLSEKPATKNEIAYARWADKTPHVVVSKTLDKVAWKATRIARDVEEIRKLKQQPGKDMHVVGGATLVSSLMNAGLIDEVRLMVNPIILGGGKALFKDVKERKSMKLVQTKPLKSGKVSLTYSTQR